LTNPLRRKKEIKIEIQLKGGKGNAKKLDESMIKVIQNEYAIKYLEALGIKASQ
jgi:hypothetical protein